MRVTKYVVERGESQPEQFKMQRIIRFKVLLALGYLQSCLFLVNGQATGTQCPPVPGEPGCVCDHPDGKLDLKRICQ